MRLLHTLGFVLFFVFSSCAQEEDTLSRSTSRSIENYAPETFLGYKIQHSYYTLSYSSTHRQAEYSYYYLSPESILGGQERTDDFRVDPKVKSNPVKSTDYQGSGFDRGHLCPAADMALDLTAMSETFYMSNMSPMAPSFNRGIWSRLEDWVREEALGNSGLYVVTGPILSSSCGSIKESITVPCAYYKIVFTGGSQPRMLGFVLSNEGASGSLQAFAVSVDEIEKNTGLDFFSQLDNGLEESLESKVNFSGWRF
jgi:endonuclease G, mitochondrial